MFIYQGKTALITGASSGIGAEFARALAARGVNVVLVARSSEKLHTLANILIQQYGIRAEVITADLSQEGAARRIIQEMEHRNLRIDLLVNNAGFGLQGYFETHPAEHDHQQVMVDVATVVGLTHAVIPSMLERPREAAIINVGSTAGFQPIPYMAVYAASKAFVLSFSLALTEEYRQRGLRVVTLCPGATDTPFFETSGEMAAVGQKRTPAQVVATGLRALEQGRALVIDGRRNDFMAGIVRLFPRQFAARIVGQMVDPRRDSTRSDRAVANT